jgi:hypothetical protein
MSEQPHDENPDCLQDLDAVEGRLRGAFAKEREGWFDGEHFLHTPENPCLICGFDIQGWGKAVRKEEIKYWMKIWRGKRNES